MVGAVKAASDRVEVLRKVLREMAGRQQLLRRRSVPYRLQRVRKLLDHDVAEETRFEMSLAIRLERLLRHGG